VNERGGNNDDIDNREDSGRSFERMSKYNLIRGEAFINGECVFVIEDSGFTNVEQVITILLSSLPDEIERPTKVQIRITNLDKQQTQLYQRISNDVPRKDNELHTISMRLGLRKWPSILAIIP
jgi:hypothetical protein